MSDKCAPHALVTLAEQWESQASDLLREMGRSSVSVEEATANPLVADALKEAATELRVALRAHRCPPAAEVATSVHRVLVHGEADASEWQDCDGEDCAACASAAPPTEIETVELYRLVDPAGVPVSAPEKDSDIYTSRDQAMADAVGLAEVYGPLTVQSASASARWSS